MFRFTGRKRHVHLIVSPIFVTDSASGNCYKYYIIYEREQRAIKVKRTSSAKSLMVIKFLDARAR